MSALTIELRLDPAAPEHDPALRATYANGGNTPLALAFWWNRSLKVIDASGNVVAPGRGPELPCGAMEEWTVLEPGEQLVRSEALACTQPAGQSADIGWSYALGPGTYRVQLQFEAPPKHGFSQSEPNPAAFSGCVLSNEVTLTVAEKPGLLSRLFGKR